MSALSAGVGGVWMSEAECIVCLCVRVNMCVYVGVCVRLCVYEWYVCLISVVSAPSAGLGGVWSSEAESYECVCCVCVLCVCVYMYVCVFVCLFVCVRVLRVYDNSCACSLCRCGWSVEE